MKSINWQPIGVDRNIARKRQDSFISLLVQKFRDRRNKVTTLVATTTQATVQSEKPAIISSLPSLPELVESSVNLIQANIGTFSESSSTSPSDLKDCECPVVIETPKPFIATELSPSTCSPVVMTEPIQIATLPSTTSQTTLSITDSTSIEKTSTTSSASVTQAPSTSSITQQPTTFSTVSPLYVEIVNKVDHNSAKISEFELQLEKLTLAVTLNTESIAVMTTRLEQVNDNLSNIFELLTLLIPEFDRQKLAVLFAKQKI